MRISVALLFALSACGGSQSSAPPAATDIDFSAEPTTTYVTNPFEIGERYTVGSPVLGTARVQPVTITAIEVIRSEGVNILGTGAFVPAPEALGLVPGWPPTEREYGIGPFEGRQWNGGVAIAIGIEVTEVPSGLRGILIRWRDGDGREGSEVVDLAVLTCNPEPCAEADVPRTYVELGLVIP